MNFPSLAVFPLLGSIMAYESILRDMAVGGKGAAWIKGKCTALMYYRFA